MLDLNVNVPDMEGLISKNSAAIDDWCMRVKNIEKINATFTSTWSGPDKQTYVNKWTTEIMPCFVQLEGLMREYNAKVSEEMKKLCDTEMEAQGILAR